jgi:3-isopropylmalate dehydratase small subunit
MASADQPLEATVDLEEQTLSFESISFSFEVNPAIKEKLLLGMDDIAESLTQIEQIKIFEKTHNAQLKD